MNSTHIVALIEPHVPANLFRRLSKQVPRPETQVIFLSASDG